MKADGSQIVKIVAGATARGYKEEDVPNQDAFSFRRMESGAFAAAVADGVGSLNDSQYFSRAAVRAVEESLVSICVSKVREGKREKKRSPQSAPYWKAPFAGFDPLSLGGLSYNRAGSHIGPLDRGLGDIRLHNIVRDRLRDELFLLRGQNGATTLLYVYLVNGVVHWGRMGDGGIYFFPVVGEGYLASEMSGKSFTYTDVLDPDNLDSSRWETGTLKADDVAHIILMTDGIQDALEDKNVFLKYFIKKMMSEQDETKAEQTLQDFIDGFPEVHGDDKTIIYINLATDRRDVSADKPMKTEIGEQERRHGSNVDDGNGPKVQGHEKDLPGGAGDCRQSAMRENGQDGGRQAAEQDEAGRDPENANTPSEDRRPE